MAGAAGSNYPLVSPGPGAEDGIRRQVTIAAAALLTACGGDLSDLAGVEGADSTLIWTASGPAEGLTLERDTGGGWYTLRDGAQQNRWLVPSVEGARYRLAMGDEVSAALTPEPVSLTLSSEISEVFLEGGQPAPFSLTVDGPAGLPGAAVQLMRSDRGGDAWLDGGCLADGGAPGDCWADAPVDLLRLDGASEVQIDDLTTREGDTRAVTLTAALVVEGEGGEGEALAEERVGYAVWDGGWLWGELHAHSNLSMDGCEVLEENCADRGDYAGQDFFQQAIDRELDFAALTDHAEYVTYRPGGEGGEEVVEIWPEQVARVQEADDGRIIPLLGYEWTFAARQEPDETGHYTGGHKTVILEGLEGCESGRLAANEDEPSYTKAIDGGYFETGNPYLAENPGDLWGGLDASECVGEAALTFAHHGAYEWPQPVDWTLESNRPDPRYEVLVEIYSEHGSSECWDVEAAHCGWHLRGNSRYWGQGSVQAALAMGYALGFVAGTDSHDARPGSTDDGPSCTARFSDTDNDGVRDTPGCHDWTGGVTGVIAPAGAGRAELLEGLRARRTVASSGPRPALRAAAFGVDGRVYLPGEEVHPESSPLRVRLEIDPEEVEVAGVELLDGWGEVRLSFDGPALDGEVELAPGEAIYLRARVGPGGDDRIWVSPWLGVDD